MSHCDGMVNNNYSGPVNACMAMSEKDEDVQKMNSPAILYAVREVIV